MNIFKKTRCENHLTQEQMAKLLGVTRKSISAYENNRVKPSAVIYYRISEKFKIPMSVLFENRNDYTLEI